MHFDILVEDASGEIMLKFLLEKMLDSQQDTYKIYKYKGIGHLPKDLKSTINPVSRTLLNQIPSLLCGFGKTHQGYGTHYDAVVIIIFDLDDKNLFTLKQELTAILESCTFQPNAQFCIAIEEGEAWLLGDIPAIQTAYPNANMSLLSRYTNDTICGTWELLADAIHSGGSIELKTKGYPFAGTVKCEWAKNITPNMDLDNNLSPSFNYFHKTIKKLRSSNVSN